MESKSTIKLINLPRGRVLAMLPSPEPDSPTTRFVLDAIDAVVAAGGAVARVREDRRLSEEGRREREAELAAALSAKLDFVRGHVGGLAKTADLAEETLFRVPPLAADDAAGAVRDREIRDGYERLGPEARSRLGGELAAGRHREVILALLRSPMPGVPNRAAEVGWRELVAAEQPEKLRDIAAMRELAGWGRQLVDRVREHARSLVGATLNAPSPADDSAGVRALAASIHAG